MTLPPPPTPLKLLIFSYKVIIVCLSIFIGDHYGPNKRGYLRAALLTPAVVEGIQLQPSQFALPLSVFFSRSPSLSLSLTSPRSTDLKKKN